MSLRGGTIPKVRDTRSCSSCDCRATLATIKNKKPRQLTGLFHYITYMMEELIF